MNDTRSWDLRLGYLIHDVSRLRRVSFDRELSPLGTTLLLAAAAFALQTHLFVRGWRLRH